MTESRCNCLGATVRIRAKNAQISGETDQLVNSSQDGSYVFDPNGNRLEVATYGGERHATFDGADELISQGMAALEWTARGDLVRKRSRNELTDYRFNYQGHLEDADLPDATSAAFRYFEPGPLMKRSESPADGVREFMWTPFGMGSVLNELDEAGDTLHSYMLAGDLILGRTSDEANFYPLVDALGSVLAVTDDDGNVVGAFDYSAWGEVLGSSVDGVPGGWPFRFVGALGVRTEATTGHQNMRYRWYSPEQSRFLSQDPMGLFGGVNRYKYARNGPTVRIDPEGLWTLEIDLSGAATYGLGVNVSVSVGVDFSGNIAVYVGGGPVFGTPDAGVALQGRVTTAADVDVLASANQIHIGGSAADKIVEGVIGIPPAKQADQAYLGLSFGEAIGLRPVEVHVQHIESKVVFRDNLGRIIKDAFPEDDCAEWRQRGNRWR